MPLPDALGHEAPLADALRVEKCRERLAHHERRGLEVRGLLRGVDHVGRAHRPKILRFAESIRDSLCLGCRPCAPLACCFP